MKCFFIRNQKVVLFPKLMENGWEAAASALSLLIWEVCLVDE